MDNLNFFALNNENAEKFELGKGFKDNELVAYILYDSTSQRTVVNIYDGSAVVLTLTGRDINVADWYGWGMG